MRYSISLFNEKGLCVLAVDGSDYDSFEQICNVWVKSQGCKAWIWDDERMKYTYFGYNA